MSVLLESMPVRGQHSKARPKWPREFSQRMEIQSIYDGDDDIRDGNGGAQPQQIRERHSRHDGRPKLSVTQPGRKRWKASVALELETDLGLHPTRLVLSMATDSGRQPSSSNRSRIIREEPNCHVGYTSRSRSDPYQGVANLWGCALPCRCQGSDGCLRAEAGSEILAMRKIDITCDLAHKHRDLSSRPLLITNFCGDSPFIFDPRAWSTWN